MMMMMMSCLVEKQDLQLLNDLIVAFVSLLYNCELNISNGTMKVSFFADTSCSL
jgi:hypothetical protein